MARGSPLIVLLNKIEIELPSTSNPMVKIFKKKSNTQSRLPNIGRRICKISNTPSYTNMTVKKTSNLEVGLAKGKKKEK